MSETPSPRGRLARNWHHLLLALGCAFVLLLLGSSHWQGTASLRALADLRQEADRVEHLDSLLIQLMDAENAVRGYLLTGNRTHLEPYRKILDTVHQTLDDIHRDLGGDRANDEPLADLTGLVVIKLRSLDNAVERGIAGEETRIQGKRYTDRIRERIYGLKARQAVDADISFARSTRHVERMRWVVLTLATGALLLMVVVFFFVERQFKLRSQIATLLRTENQRLDALVQERTAELSDLASYLTNVREAEKQCLARELHDELGALLTAAKMESGWLVRKIDGADGVPLQEHLARLEAYLDRGIALKRRIIDGLRPPLLEALGLISTLRLLVEEFAEGNGEKLTLDLPEDNVPLPPATALAIYRIAQEALTNIRKHAAARHVHLSLHVAAGQLELVVTDDGAGFRTGWVRGRHHGLIGMKHRVQMCAGDFSVTSQPGQGTRIVVHIPLPVATASDMQPDAAART